MRSLFLGLLLIPTVARAQDAAPSTAPASSSARGGTEPIVLIVTNNSSAQLGRPALKYADDDGAKYFELFQTLNGREPELLTTFDRDTAKQHPSLIEKVKLRPTKANVEAAFARAARLATEAKAAGKIPEFTFVFAGHGDVDQGQGLLELEDGVLRASELRTHIAKIPAKVHVILDSCNSFFVLNARKPGGRRFPTPEDAAKQLSEELPDVGVFLSTSAEAEVFEWSELGGGIFSHVVRSGLAGGADANADGKVSYAELRAFTDIATRTVKNPRLRPTVFARGPGGNDAAPLAVRHSKETAELTFAGEKAERLTLRDSEEVPWADVHREGGASLRLILPERLAKGATLERREGSGEPERLFVRVAGAGSTEMTKTPESQALASRGPQEALRALYADGFGPEAMAEYEKERTHAAPPVFGASAEDRRRLELVLTQVAEDERGRRNVAGVGAIAIGGTLLAGALLAYRPSRGDTAAELGTVLGLGGAMAGVGTYLLLSPGIGETIHAGYIARRASGVSDATNLATTEKAIVELQEDYRTTRKVQRVVSAIGMAGGAALATLPWIFNAGTDYDNKVGSTILGGYMAGIFAIVFASSFNPFAIERMGSLWLDDSARVKPSLAISPTGASLTVSGVY